MDSDRTRIDTATPLRTAVCAAALALVAAATGCHRDTTRPAAAPQKPLIEECRSGPLSAVVSAQPAAVEFNKDTLLSIRVTAPSNVVVRFPSMDDRLSGFTLAGAFEREPVASDGNLVRELCVRLTPVVGAEHRLAPMAITYEDHRRDPPESGWLRTHAMVFETAPLVSAGKAPALNEIAGPVWIRPPFTTVLLYVLIALAAVALVVLLVYLARRWRRTVALRRLSPKERALHELDDLLRQNLVGKGEVKEFYFEITMIVRRYIERQHGVRAPEQTTEEFLAAASANPHFGAEVLARLRAFLVAADLVKYAAYHPETSAVTQAVQTARDYFETDAATEAQQEEAQGHVPAG